MGSLVPGWDKSYQKPKGLSDFDDVLIPDEPVTPGSEYQRQVMKKYLQRGTSLLGEPAARNAEATNLTRAPSLKRDSAPSLKRDSLSLKRESANSGLDATSPRLNRAGSLRMPARTLSGPGSVTSPTAAAAQEAVAEGPGGSDKATVHGWWDRMDSAAMNRQVEEGDDEYRSGSYKPQYDVAGARINFVMPTKA